MQLWTPRGSEGLPRSIVVRRQRPPVNRRSGSLNGVSRSPSSSPIVRGSRASSPRPNLRDDAPFSRSSICRCNSPRASSSPSSGGGAEKGPRRGPSSSKRRQTRARHRERRRPCSARVRALSYTMYRRSAAGDAVDAVAGPNSPGEPLAFLAAHVRRAQALPRRSSVWAGRSCETPWALTLAQPDVAPRARTHQ